jgi:molecular chaperone IbpA
MNTTENLLDVLFSNTLGLQSSRLRNDKSGFPPYNIITDSVKAPSYYLIEMAVAGFSRENLSIKIKNDSGVPVLVVEGTRSDPEGDRTYVVRGLAARSFAREFILSNDLQPKNIRLKDGILSIELESKKPKNTEIVLNIT